MATLRWSSTEDMLRALAHSERSGSARLGDEVTVRIEGLDGAFIVPTAMRAEERINELFQIDLIADVSGVAEDSLRSAALGRAIHIVIQRRHGEPRRLHGIIAKASLRAYRDGSANYHFHILPKLWLADKTIDSRVFSDLTIQEIVTTVLNDNGVIHAWSLTKRYERREYVVQWEESDYAFVKRLLAECGIFFSFYHPPNVEALRERLALSLPTQLGNEVVGVAQQGFSEESLRGAGERVLGQAGTILAITEVNAVGELLVLADDAATYASLDDPSELSFDATLDGGALAHDETHVPLFQVKSAIEPTRATVREYDHERAQQRPHGTVLATLPEGFRGTLADGMSALQGATNEAINQSLSEVEGAAAVAGPIAQASGVSLTDPMSALGSMNEHHAFGVITATQAVMAPEVAVARSAVAMAGALGEELLSSTPLAGAADAVAGGVRNLIGGAESVLEHYEHHGEYEEVEASAQLARTRIEQLRSHHIHCHGTSRCRSLSAGQKFTLSGHPLPHLNRGYALTHVVHEVFDDEHATYQNAFACIPSHVPARPHPPHRRIHQNMETAVVVGHEGQEIETQHLGKVKVQFHWDRRGRHDEHSSCWIRVMQPWAGAGFGFQFIPRIGMEVLVSFIGGDMNRPVVVGCMPNLTNHPPYHLPEDKTQSGIRTQSSPGGGGHNELMFEDAAGREEVVLRAQRNHAVTVLHDETVSIGHNQETLIGGQQVRRIGGRHEGHIEGDDTVRVGGHRTREVAQNAVERFGGGHTRTVGSHETVEVSGDRSVTVHGSLNTIVGGEEDNIATAMTLINGHHRLSVSESMSIGAEGDITIRCGNASLRMTPDEIILSAPRVRIEGEDDLRLSRQEGTIQVGDETIVEAQVVHAASDGADLKLNDKAWLNGAKVLLNCNADSADLDSDTVEQGQGRVRYRVESEHDDGPFTLVIMDPSGNRIERQTDANNEVELEGRPGDGFALVEVRSGDTSIPYTAPEEGQGEET